MSTVPWLDIIIVLGLALVATFFTIGTMPSHVIDEAILEDPPRRAHPWWGVPPSLQQYWLFTLSERINPEQPADL